MNTMLSYFEDWPQTIVAIEEKKTTMVGGKPSESWVAVSGLDSVSCWMFRARDARAFLNDKFRNMASLVLLFDPASLGSSVLNSKMRCSINGLYWYFNTPENISNFGEVLQVVADGEPHA